LPAICERARGPYHPQVVSNLYNLASVYYQQGIYAKALPLHKRALNVAEAALGHGHPDAKLIRRNLTIRKGLLTFRNLKRKLRFWKK
jgi:hypothetical protein